MIKSTELGYPVMLDNIVGRIVGYSDKGSWGYINDVKIFSIPMIGTPHGSVIDSGVMYLEEMTPEGMFKLETYEDEIRYSLEPIYNGVLDNILPKDTETYPAKLRNALTPLYGLSQMILLLEVKDKYEISELMNLIIDSAKQAEKNRPRIDKLLKLIDSK